MLIHSTQGEVHNVPQLFMSLDSVCSYSTFLLAYCWHSLVPRLVCGPTHKPGNEANCGHRGAECGHNTTED